jgi:hypothetical protein
MPKEEAWRKATLAGSRAHHDRLWLICNYCQRSYLVMHDEFVAFHRLGSSTPLLLINKRLRCVACGEKNGQCRSETHGSEAMKAYPVVGSPVEGPQPARRIHQPHPEPRRVRWPEIEEDEQIEF